MSSHATEEMDDDDLSISDLESIVLTGEIIEVQRDPEMREQKFGIRRRTIANAPACTTDGPSLAKLKADWYREASCLPPKSQDLNLRAPVYTDRGKDKSCKRS